VASALAAAIATVAIVGVALAPSRGPAAAAPAEPAPAPLPRAVGPAPGTLVVTAAPWGEVVRLSGPDGGPVDLPENRVTPLRLWVAPGAHSAEIVLSGGESVTCSADVAEGGTHRCHVEMPDSSTITDYWKAVGWWP
jgi:hypothetical protein